MVKHCCYGFCRSDSRYAERADMQGVFFVAFPKSKTEPEKCVRWFLACGREDITLEKVKRDTYICSKHFVGGHGPTDSNPDPIPVPDEDFTSDIALSTKTKKRVCRPAELAKKLFGEHGEQIMLGQISSSYFGLTLDRLTSHDHPGKRQVQHEYVEEEHNKRIKLHSGMPPDQDEGETIVIKMEPVDDYEEENYMPSHQPSTSLASHSTSTSHATQASHLQLPNSASKSSFTTGTTKKQSFSRPGRQLSQSPAAVRVRRCRQRMITNNRQKYEQMKEYDRIRAKEYRKNLTEEQKIRIRQSAKERTRRFRLRKKLQALGVTASDGLLQREISRELCKDGRNRASGKHSSQSVSSTSKDSTSSTYSETQPEMVLTSQPTAAAASTFTPYISLQSQHAPVQYQTISSFHRSVHNTNEDITPRIDTEQQCIMVDTGMTQQLSSCGVETGVAASQNVPTDVFMWAGPDMVDQGTNTNTPSLPTTVEKCCQIHVKCADASSQTDLTLSDLGMFTDSQIADPGLGRRKFIAGDVMHDDRTCQFYTGFSLVMLVWLFDWLKESIQEDKSTREQRNKSGLQQDEESKGGQLSHLEQFLLVMIWLRKGLDFEFLGHLFGVTCDTVHTVCDTWVNIMQKQFRIINVLHDMKNVTLTGKLNLKSQDKSSSCETGEDNREVNYADMMSTSGVPEQRSLLNGPNETDYECAEPDSNIDIMFHKKGNVNFYFNNRHKFGNPISGSIIRYTAKMQLAKTGIFNLVTQLSPSVACMNKSVLKMWRGANKHKSRNYQQPKKSTRRTISKNGVTKRRLSKRNPRHVARQRHVLKTRALRELSEYKILQTMHPYSHRLLVRNALMVCISLGNFIVTDTISAVR